MKAFSRQLTLCAAVLFCLILPAGALASGKAKQKHRPVPPPAQVIYQERVKTAGGTKTIAPVGGGSNTSGPSGTVSLSPKASRALQAKGGNATKILKEIATNKDLGAHNSVAKGTRTANRVASGPSPVSSAINAGSGLEVLVAVILGSALLIGVAAVQQRRRHR